MRPLNRAALALAVFLIVFGVWSAQGRFATTLHVPGTIGSTAPSQPVQHQWGGRLAEIAVDLHDAVEAGDVLFRLDATDLDLQLAALEHRRTLLTAELAEIGKRLASDLLVSPLAERPAQVVLAYAAEEDTLAAEIADLDVQSTTAARQQGEITRELKHLYSLQAILKAQRGRVSVLAEKGLATDQALEAAEQKVLELAARIATQRAKREEYQAQSLRTARSAELLRARYQRDLAARQLALSHELTGLEAEYARLSLQRSEATLRAPISGTIASLDFPAAGAAVPGGATLAVIAPPLGQPHAELRVPPNYIDQVRVGQSGILTLPELPQRNLPRIDLTVAGVAASPVRDGDGNVLYYTARVNIAPEALVAARDALGARFRLVSGMPVSAALNGAQTSLWHYLAAPLIDTLRMGFEE